MDGAYWRAVGVTALIFTNELSAQVQGAKQLAGLRAVKHSGKILRHIDFLTVESFPGFLAPTSRATE